MKKAICVSLILIAALLSGCSSKNEMKDGFYTAEMSDYYFGWKEYLCIMVKDDKVVYAEFNAKNPSGYIKAWDNAYMKNMKPVSGTYPNEYTRTYVSELIETQDPEKCETLTGATSSSTNYSKLSVALVEHPKKVDSKINIVKSETAEE